MIPFFLKKWYFDLLSAEGDALYFYFITARVARFAQGLASAHLLLADGGEVRAVDKTPFAVPDAKGGLRLGRHAFYYDGGSQVEVRMSFGNLILNLTYAPRLGPWWPAERGVILKQNGRVTRDLRWHVAVPSARVEGVLAFGGRTKSVAGDGYIDVVETTIPPWRLPLAELRWGRAHFAGRTVVFNQIRTREGKVVQNLLLTESRADAALGQRPVLDEQSFTLQSDPCDVLTSLGREGAYGLLLSRPKTIEESPVVTPERFKSASARRFLASLTGDPREKKMVSRARLELDGETVAGQALHEQVSWHWPKEEDHARQP